VIRTPSPRNPGQEKSQVQIKRRQKGQEVYLLCLSEGRKEKDRAIRETHQLRLKKDWEKLTQLPRPLTGFRRFREGRVLFSAIGTHTGKIVTNMCNHFP
jgi:hypothetical protein